MVSVMRAASATIWTRWLVRNGGDGPGPSPQAGFGSRMLLSLSSFVEPHFLHARVRSSNFQLNRIGLIRIMTISVPQLGHADDASASGGVSGTATRFPFP